MLIKKINEMFRGWFIGDFEPSVYKTAEFEVGYLQHKKDEVWKAHYHSVGTEINYLIRGKMIIQNTELKAGDIFVLYPGEIADPIFLEDCELIVVKTPSIPNDKYIVE
jgi:quercetin dioxygenase-like cupin family protein